MFYLSFTHRPNFFRIGVIHHNVKYTIENNNNNNPTTTKLMTETTHKNNKSTTAELLMTEITHIQNKSTTIKLLMTETHKKINQKSTLKLLMTETTLTEMFTVKWKLMYQYQICCKNQLPHYQHHFVMFLHVAAN